VTRFGLFGGTFDPVHYGHLRPVEAARVALNLEHVLILPNPRPPHKRHQSLTPYRHRKNMLKLALAEFPHLKMADYEERAIGPAYTTDTVKRVLEDLPDVPRELWLIIGADSLVELPQWRDPEDLFRHARVAVLPRPGVIIDEADPTYRRRVTELATPLVDISATDLRSRLSIDERPTDLLPESVIDYIVRHDLYRTPS